MSKQFRNRQISLWLSCPYTYLCILFLCAFSSFKSFAQSNLTSSINLVGIDYASSGDCLKMNAVYQLKITNSGTDHTDSTALILPFSAADQLSGALEGIIDISIENSTGQSAITLDQTYTGGQEPLAELTFLASGATLDILVVIELNPYLPGLTAFDGVQARLESIQTPSLLYDLSDGGSNPLSNNSGTIGNTGGTDDPLPFDIAFLTSQFLVLNTNLTVALNTSCSIDLNIDLFAENPAPGSTEDDLPYGSYYDYTLYDDQGQAVSFSNLHEYLGEQLQLEITHKLSCSTFWTQIEILDNLAPSFLNLLVVDTVSCFQDFNTLPAPLATDNCSEELTYHLVQQVFLDNDLCDDQTEIVRRHWVSMDASLNQSVPAIQEIVIYRDTQIDFPNDMIIECSAYSEDPDLVNPDSTGAGIPLSFADLDLTDCNYSYVSSDQLIPTCGNGFKIIRLWTVLDWCTGTIISSNDQGEDNIQLIEVADTKAPEITAIDFSLSASEKGPNDFECFSLGFIPAPVVTDECNDFDIYIITPVGEAIYLNGNDASNGALIPQPGLGLGMHTLVYQAIDICGNVSELNYTVQVVDDITPTMICDEISTVALNNTGIAEVPAFNFDDGSFDNCCLSGFEGSRDNGLSFNDDLYFDCADVGEQINILVRLTDCFGNSNICSVEVIVEDNTSPVLFAPADMAIGCLSYYEEILPALETGNYSVLDNFGLPQSYDNCTINMQDSVVWETDNCGNGWIHRFWNVSDQSGNSGGTAEQIITVYSEGNWSVDFPEDIVYECGDSLSLDQLPGPQISGNYCFQIAQTYSDETYTFTGGNCKTIHRTWELINWCTFPNEPAITHVQVIDILDTEAPEIYIENQDFYLSAGQCSMQLVLEEALISDCSDSVSVNINAPYGENEFWPVGAYPVTYTAVDWCGNQSSSSILIEVFDTIAPTMFTQDQLNIDLSDGGVVEVFAADFNIGSFDNCTSLSFSFSGDSIQTSLLFTCDELGENNLQIWGFDDYGNASFVEVILLLSDNMSNCSEDLLYDGTATMPDGLGLEGVEISSHTGEILSITQTEGEFNILMPNSDTTVLEAFYPSSDWTNGVSTFDLVLIKKHILGIEPFDDPYQFWAADVNGSESVSTLDIVFIQKLILGILDEFPVGDNWSCFFDNGSSEPWTQNKTLLLNEAIQEEGIELKVIKLGDVNYNATPE